MKLNLQVVIEADNGTPTVVQEVGSAGEPGLKLTEAKDLWQAIQQALEEQVRAALARQPACTYCGVRRCASCSAWCGCAARGCHCPCWPHSTRTYSPLAELLPCGRAGVAASGRLARWADFPMGSAAKRRETPALGVPQTQAHMVCRSL